MRREQQFGMPRDEAIRFLADSPVIHLATTDGDGQPVLRTVNAVVVDELVAFHGSPIGEKVSALGRPAVIAAEETVASIPSYFTDPERACPATTFYRSIQVHGRLDEIGDPDTKARVMAALMQKYQPEGQHQPITAEDPLYKKALAGILVVGVSLRTIDGKAKLGQHRSAVQVSRLVEQLWQRGAPTDPRAIELVRRANPAAPTPAFLACPDGATLVCSLDRGRAAEAVALLRDAYWQVGVPDETIRQAQLGASAWVGAVDGDGRLVATARAISDGAKWAGVFDVVVAPRWRGRGLGQAVVRLLLDHPRVRAVRRVWLGTRDAQTLYARFGFVPGPMIPPRTFATTEMVLLRA